MANTALKKKEEFSRVFRFGRTAKGEGVLLRYLSNNLPYNRFAFIVSKKTVPTAVGRNKIKRRLRELTRKQKKSARGGIDGVFVINRNISKASSADMRQKLEAIFNKALTR